MNITLLISLDKNGGTTMHAYNKAYLEDAMHNMGIMADYAVNVEGLSESEFWSRFLVSGIAERFGKGNPDIIAGLSGIELAIAVMKTTGKKIEIVTASASISSPQYWAGWILAYYQWLEGLSFKQLSKSGLNLQTTANMFNPLHEADLSSFVEIANKMTCSSKSSNLLKNIRKQNGLTQEELSKKSGVSLRLIRAYEQGTIDMYKAEYRTIENLAKALRYEIM